MVWCGVNRTGKPKNQTRKLETERVCGAFLVDCEEEDWRLGFGWLKNLFSPSDRDRQETDKWTGAIHKHPNRIHTAICRVIRAHTLYNSPHGVGFWVLK